MESQLKTFLEFNGRSIYILAKDGQNWVALKPICEALNVDWINQFKNLKEDEILGQLLSEQTMVGADGRVRKMTSLPEKWVYGWLFSIRSESKELKLYKVKCYELLYDYFRGAMTERLEALKVKTSAELRWEELKKQQENSDVSKEMKALEKVIKNSNKTLVINDRKLVQSQLNIFNQEDRVSHFQSENSRSENDFQDGNSHLENKTQFDNNQSED